MYVPIKGIPRVTILTTKNIITRLEQFSRDISSSLVLLY